MEMAAHVPSVTMMSTTTTTTTNQQPEMTEEEQSSPLYVFEPNHNDVLLGKGSSANEFVGNQRFVEIAKRRHIEYTASRKYDEKQRIALEVLAEVGGRFLQKVDGKEFWIEADHSVVLKKIKQACRQRREPTKESRTNSSVVEDGTKALGNTNNSLGYEEDFLHLQELKSPSNAFDSGVMQATIHATPLAPELISSQGEQQAGQEQTAEKTTFLDDEAADLLLSIIKQPSHVHFTQEDEELERASLTNEERAAALADLFGKQCAISIRSNAKRSRRDLDRDSVDFLIHQMRHELNQIPARKKPALVKATLECHKDEFSDARLERFLRCEGMNVMLGAQRFVEYWECRREVFGPNKYLLPMTLAGALRDDLAALNSCVYRILPGLDSHGRKILFNIPKNNTREGYTTESMIRAFWYLEEVMSHETTNEHSGMVIIALSKGMTIWDYDHKFNDRVGYFNKWCMPVRCTAFHICTPSGFVLNLVKPILFAAIDKHLRCRTLVHNVPDDQLLKVMEESGITKDLLPIEMGGTVQLDQSAWIGGRYAVELEINTNAKRLYM